MAEEAKLQGFGPEMPIVGGLEIGGAKDAAVAGNLLCVVGGDTLRTADITTPAQPRPLGQIGGLGHVRQVALAGGIAYVTSREDGLYVVDIRKPEAPALLSHYDTVELATGIAVEGNLAAVANRHYGVEFIDVSDPRKPRFLGLVRVGEAQSVVLRDGYAYAGAWSQRQLVICDVRNPRAPVVVGRAPLDGFGDGVCVQGNLCFAATGHHARSLKNHRDESDPAFGKGHGMEIFDISDPAQPRRLSGLKLPPFYSQAIDFWDVQVCGRYAFVGDTFAGLFVVDVSDPRQPTFVGHVQLPVVPKRGQRGPVGGFALAKDVAYVAGVWTDLHVVDARGLASPVAERPTPPQPAWGSEREASAPSVYRPDGQVHAAAFAPDKDTAYVAAGAAGVHLVRLRPRPERIGGIETRDFAFDVAVSGSRLYVAEGSGGLSVWDCSRAAEPVLLGRYQPEKCRVFQVSIAIPGRFALLHVDQVHLHVVDISDPKAMRLVLRDERYGLLYRLPLAEGSLNGRYAGCLWHASGYHWFDLGAEPAPTYAGVALAGPINACDGMAFVGDRALVIQAGRYTLMAPGAEPRVVALPVPRAGGKPTVVGSRLYLSSRWDGSVHAFDITDLGAPAPLWHRELPGNPGLIRERDGILLIPAGYQGLLVCDPKTGEAL